jgi:hypothetical protein
MVAYDSDHSRRLCAAELEVFFREQWPQATLRSGTGVFERAESQLLKVRAPPDSHLVSTWRIARSSA